MAKRKSTRKPQAAVQSNNMLRNVMVGASIFVGIVLLGALLFMSLRPEPEIAGVVNYLRQTRGHDNTLEYAFEELPPAGGTHNDAWQNCGIYDTPVPPEHAIHSMEHGAVWITYQPELSPAAVAQLQDSVRGQTYILLSPYPNQRSPIVLTAWGVQLELEDVGDGRIAQFINRYRVGPQTPERGAACTGGVGAPTG
jgi:hypothetical protein